MTEVTRRRFIAIAAAGLAGRFDAAAADQPPLALWRGIALGAEAEIRIDGHDDVDALQMINLVRGEIERLENLFSLYRAESAISQLNANGALYAPDPDFLALLSTAANIYRATSGLFDPTVQPIWDAYARECSGDAVCADGVGAAISEVGRRSRAAVGFEHVVFGAEKIAFRRPGMAMTLNGIAQGYITDRVADLLKANGLRHVLVNMGEIRALAGRRDGSGWPVHVAVSRGERLRRRTILLSNQALATSATLGTTLDAAGRLGHILDPRTGAPLSERRQVTVEAPTATLADGLSTALCLMCDRDADATLGAFPGTRVCARV